MSLGLTRFAAALAIFTMLQGGLASCQSLEDFGMVTDDALLQRSAALPAFTDDQAGGQPKTLSDLGHVWADACKYRYNPPDVGKQAALAQLRARALQRGGNGISHLRFMLITNNRSPCWHGYEASGDAVVFDLARGA